MRRALFRALLAFSTVTGRGLGLLIVLPVLYLCGKYAFGWQVDNLHVEWGTVLAVALVVWLIA